MIEQGTYLRHCSSITIGTTIVIEVNPVHAVVIISMIKYFVVYISNCNNQLVLVVLMSE